VSLLTWSIIEAPRHGWGSALTIGELAGAVAILAAFAVHQARRPDPMLDVRLFRNPRFTAASASISLAFFGLFGFIFLITQYFQAVRGFGPLRAGLATLPFAIVTGALAPVSIIAMKKAGTKLVVALGLLLMSGGFAIAATMSLEASYWRVIVISMSLMAAGLAFATGPATEAIMGALPAGKAGAGSAVNDTTRELGGTLGVAIVGSVLASAYGSHVTSSLGALGAPRAAVSAASQSVEAGLITAARFPHALSGPATQAARQAFMSGLHGGSWVSAIATAAAAALALAFLPARAAGARPGGGEPGVPEPSRRPAGSAKIPSA
jgi:hypothetical protein